jgi:NitT/TauT family transport system substrate-binding protein
MQKAVLHAMLLAALAAPLAPARAQTTAVRVATMPVTNFSQLVVARDKGFFAEEKLEVTWTIVAQGALAVEAVYGGSAEFGGGAVLEPMLARGNGLDVMLVVPTTRINTGPPDNSALLVRKDDPINNAKDLSGKTISVGLINSINYVHMLEWLQMKGVDPKTVTFLELPFPQHADALLQKRLDCVWAVEPFLTLMTRTGNVRVLATPYLDTNPGMDITAFVAKESWIKSNPDVARRFKRAIDKASNLLIAASKEERDGWVAKFSGLKPELVSGMSLPVFTNEFHPSTLRRNLDIAVKNKVVKPFDVETMIWKP